MSWIPITIATLDEARVAALIDACSEKALRDGQPNRAPGIIQGVINTVRRKVASNPNNRVDADPATIPAGLRDPAVDMIVVRLKMAVLMTPKPEELTALERAELELNRVADGKDTVDQADVPVAPNVEASVGIEYISGGQGIASDERMQGL